MGLVLLFFIKGRVVRIKESQMGGRGTIFAPNSACKPKVAVVKKMFHLFNSIQFPHLFQRLSLALQKGNAALSLSRSTDVQHPDILGQF